MTGFADNEKELHLVSWCHAPHRPQTSGGRSSKPLIGAPIARRNVAGWKTTLREMKQRYSLVEWLASMGIDILCLQEV